MGAKEGKKKSHQAVAAAWWRGRKIDRLSTPYYIKLEG